MGERPINPKLNVLEKTKQVNIINPYRYNKWTPFVISAWKMQGNSNDSIGSNNGSDTSMSYTTGIVGQAADFSAGTSSKIDVADDDSLSFGDGSTDSPFSVTFWVKFNTIQDSFLVDKRSPREYSIWFDNISAGDKKFVVRLFDESASAYIGRTYDYPSATTATWYHVAVTYSGSATVGGINLYLDGTLLGHVNQSSGTYTAMENSTGTLKFGKLTASTAWSLDGLMDDIILWNKELSASELAEIEADQRNGIDIL